MTQEQYETQKAQIESDSRYPPALKQWALAQLREMYEADKQDKAEAEG